MHKSTCGKKMRVNGIKMRAHGIKMRVHRE